MSLHALIVLSNLFLLVHSYKILALFPHPGKSHVDVFLPLTKALARKGHEVTVISHFPLKTPQINYTDVSLGNETTPLINILDMDNKARTRWEKWGIIHLLQEFAAYSCKIGFESSQLREFLRHERTFDVIIVEFFNSDCFAGLVQKFKAPVVGISSCTIMHWTNERFGNPTHPAYIPNNLMEFSDRMTFFQRIENLLSGLFHHFFYNKIIMNTDETLIRKYLGYETPTLKQIVFNASLLLVNTHFSLNLPRPLVPAVIEVGGIHIDKPKKIPENLEKWINESAHGVIYFSLGSMIKGHTFPDEKRSEFLKAFGRLPQRVLWKWENETMSGKPDNVMIQKWMPQLDILCHPNVKAFISHGGLLGTTEAVHCGVPVVVMPQYGDQFTNARALEANGGGVILHLSEATEERIYDALKTILDPRFQKQAKELSARFRDRPLPPLETAIYWVEYVARHRGAHHMRTAAVDMPLYKYLLLDVIAFLVLVAGLLFALFFYATRAILRKLFTKRDKQKTN
ncbi:UDP-glycosyltransferase UGT5 isoform X3 [Tribolium castaneum]|uniref:UDP-glucuronosyltransferase n=1 Tax=Tribolium castaneum TaxID=7070 RepID=D2A2V5_TRICA|nr:PREDICTED: UDP-glucuronosyltransferase 1-7 isoform X3 [Tribolium castaneum]EFA02977.2 UDP-glucuronosyltransferase 1-7-like Protein [Tribolium castaneum]|eukprot:XP_008191817.1 PREDICTED: UDP-glucuronosyltransferase 1-7 isoform X3 [Tribolium castaneum]